MTPESAVRLLRLAPPVEGVAPLQLRAFATVEEEFTDNANQTRDNRQSEFRTSIAPGLQARLERAQTSLNLVYAPRYFLRDNRPDDSTVDQNLTLRSTWNVATRIRLGVAEDFTKSTDFRDVQDIGTRRTGQGGFIRNQGTVETAYSPPQGRAGLSYTNILVQNDAPGGDDSLTHIVRTDAQLTHPRLSLTGAYTLSRKEFQISSAYWEHTVEARARHALAPTAGLIWSGALTSHDADRAGDFTDGRIRLGGTLGLGPTGILEAAAGADVFAPQGEPPKVHPSVLLNWVQQFSMLSLTAQYEQGYQRNLTAVQNTGVTFTRSAAVSLSTSRLALRDLAATLTLRYVENDFQQNVPVSDVRAGTVDRTWDVDFGVRYSILRPLSLTLGYVFTIRHSTDPRAEFLENRVRFGLTYQYDLY